MKKSVFISNYVYHLAPLIQLGSYDKPYNDPAHKRLIYMSTGCQSREAPQQEPFVGFMPDWFSLFNGLVIYNTITIMLILFNSQKIVKDFF
jgi:hypothetical protein